MPVVFQVYTSYKSISLKVKALNSLNRCTNNLGKYTNKYLSGYTCICTYIQVICAPT